MNDLNEFRNRIALIGNRDAVFIFKALGADVYFTENAEPEILLKELIEKKYPIILITEGAAVTASKFIETQNNLTFPVILPIPDGINKLGCGEKKLNSNTEKAILAKPAGRI